MHINELLTTTCELGASDLHLKVGNYPIARIKGRLTPLTQFKRLVQEDTIAMAYSIMATDRQKAKFKEQLDADLAYSVPALGRFRCNIFNQRGTVGMVLRVIPRRIYSIEDLMLPRVLAKICEEQRGMVLVTGTTGSGKSTTLAAMIDLINATRIEHILTIEDPIEYLHRDNQSIINQREVGADCSSFATALRAALRQDPDVILVGEIRDSETAMEAIRASQTGHVVLSTLHSNDAVDAVQRLLDLGMHPNGIASELLAVIAQRLAKRVCPHCREEDRAPDVEILRELYPDGPPHGFRCFKGRGCEVCRGRGTLGRVAAVEFLRATPDVRRAISRRLPVDDLRDVALSSGLHTMRESALALVRDGVIPLSEMSSLLPVERMAGHGKPAPVSNIEA